MKGPDEVKQSRITFEAWQTGSGRRVVFVFDWENDCWCSDDYVVPADKMDGLDPREI